MSALARTFVIRSAEDAKRIMAFLKLNAPEAIERGEPLEATVRIHKPHASDAQRALIWIVNDQIAEQAWVRGRQYDASTWHEHAKRELLPEENSRGKKKWRMLPDDSRELAMSTEAQLAAIGKGKLADPEFFDRMLKANMITAGLPVPGPRNRTPGAPKPSLPEGVRDLPNG